MKSVKVIIAGGGTGGHIYPALAIAQALKKIGLEKKIQCDVQFVGTSIGLEIKIIPAHNFKLHLIASGKLNYAGQIFEKVKTLLKLPFGFLQSVVILMTEKPNYVIGVGGYASAPFLLAASLMGYRCVIWEPNAHPGLANRILSRFISRAFVVFKESEKLLKCSQITVSGMPLRDEIENAREQIETHKGPLEDSKRQFTILCFGGSQGSQFLNTQLSDYLLSLQSIDGLYVVHQTGTSDFERMKIKYGKDKEKNKNIELLPYIENMPYYLSQADMLFCRGGASTLAEAAAYGVVPVVVPLPAADNHQQSNAESLVTSQSGFMILQNDFKIEKLSEFISQLRTNSDIKSKMKTALMARAPHRAAEQIARSLFLELEIL